MGDQADIDFDNGMMYYKRGYSTKQLDFPKEIKMAAKRAKKTKSTVTNKPVLVAVGNHMIDITDVSCISKINNKDLYVVRLKSQPNMEYPIWVNKSEIGGLIEHFNIKVQD